MRRPVANVLLLASVVLVAANLRGSITSVGSVIGIIGASENLSAVELGIIGSMPVLAFAVVSPFVSLFSRRLGIERTLVRIRLAQPGFGCFRAFGHDLGSGGRRMLTAETKEG